MGIINIIGWTLLGICILFNLCYTAYKHGKPRDNYNFWVILISTIVDLSIIMMIIWK